MAELQADFELLPRETLEAEIELEPREEIEATFELNVNTEGRDAKINGVNTLTLTAEDGIVLNQVEDVATLSGGPLQQAIENEQEARQQADESLQEAIDTKQPIISDIDTIRSNAEAGKQASDAIETYGDIVTHDVDEFATAAQGGLADTAIQPGDDVSELQNDAGYINKDVDNLTNYTKSSELSEVATSGKYQDLTGLPTIGSGVLTIQKNSTTIDTFSANATSNKTVNITVPTTAADVGALPDTTTINDLTTQEQQNALNSGIDSTLVGQIGTNQSDISDIQGLIPSQATTSNQLADKDFVNSSISTNTANFIGTFNSVAELEAYSGTLTNNDYAFVIVTDSQGNTAYDRYKYTTATTPPSWQFEYELNNSSFTAEQWAAINSGATTTNVGQIATNTGDISDINTTIGGYGDIVTHDADEFATAAQGALADTALQPGDNISELVNDSGYITGITSSDVTTALGFTPYDSTNPSGYISGITSLMVTTALGYTPYDATNPNGYISGITSSDVTTALGFTPYDSSNPDGFISGITSGDVTTALGYTPYDSSNPAGYTTNVGTVTSVNNVGPDGNGDVTLTASDVGALPSSTTIGNGTLTIQKNGTAVQTFTANQTGNATANITVPTDTGDLTNGAGYITGITSLMVTTALGYTPANVTALSDYVTIAGAETITGAKTFTEPVTIQNGQGTGCLIVGANVNSSTLSNNQRKLARINAPSYANKDLGATLIGWDTSGDSDSPVTNKSYDSVCFGGMKKITNCTSPMSITFCVTDTRAATAAANKKYALAMDANEAIFGVQPKYNGYNLATMNDLPTVNNATLTIQKNGTSVATFTANSSTNTTANITVPTTAADVSALPSSTKYGADLSYSSSTLQLLDQDGNTIGNPVTITSGGGNTNNLLDFKWVDHELNDQSWLKADTFSWQDGTVYSDAYGHLVDDIDGKAAQTETIGSYTISYYLADDGHKITTDETTVQNIYNETGVAWYYVLDTANQRFKLPRTKYGFNGLRDAVGKYIPESLPNIKGKTAFGTSDALGQTVSPTSAYTSGAFKRQNLGFNVTRAGGSSSSSSNEAYLVMDASNYSSTYQDSAPVQQRATQMYLYFYVGQFSQSATEQTAGLNTSLFNGKADTDFGNVDNTNNAAANNLNTAGIRTIVETYSNGTSWYRLYSDGWCEQGGLTTSHQYNTNNKQVSFIKTYRDTNYTAVTSAGPTTDVKWEMSTRIAIKYTDGLDIRGGQNGSQAYTGSCSWIACGYVS